METSCICINFFYLQHCNAKTVFETRGEAHACRQAKSYLSILLKELCGRGKAVFHVDIAAT